MFENLARPIEIGEDITSDSETSDILEAKRQYTKALERHALDIQNDPNFDLDEADGRFSGALNLRRLRSKHVCVIGAGGIGTWVIKALAGMGVRDISIVDDDVVEIHNVGPQSHNLTDIGKSKVEAMQEAMLEHRSIKVKAVKERVNNYRHLLELLGTVPDILVMAVDNMTIRNEIGRSLLGGDISGNDMPDLYIDPRMSLGQWNVYALPIKAMAFGASQLNEDLRVRALSHFENACLFDDSEGVQEACTERAIIYTGMNIATYIGALVHWVNDNPLRRENLNGFLDMDSNPRHFPFKWQRSFDSRNWKDLSARPNPKMVEKIRRFGEKLKAQEEEIRNLQGQKDSLVSLLKENALFEPLDAMPEIGDVLVYTVDGDVYVSPVVFTSGEYGSTSFLIYALRDNNNNNNNNTRIDAFADTQNILGVCKERHVKTYMPKNQEFVYIRPQGPQASKAVGYLTTSTSDYAEYPVLVCDSDITNVRVSRSYGGPVLTLLTYDVMPPDEYTPEQKETIEMLYWRKEHVTHLLIKVREHIEVGDKITVAPFAVTPSWNGQSWGYLKKQTLQVTSLDMTNYAEVIDEAGNRFMVSFSDVWTIQDKYSLPEYYKRMMNQGLDVSDTEEEGEAPEDSVEDEVRMQLIEVLNESTDVDTSEKQKALSILSSLFNDLGKAPSVSRRLLKHLRCFIVGVYRNSEDRGIYVRLKIDGMHYALVLKTSGYRTLRSFREDFEGISRISKPAFPLRTLGQLLDHLRDSQYVLTPTALLLRPFAQPAEDERLTAEQDTRTHSLKILLESSRKLLQRNDVDWADIVRNL